MWPLAHLWSFWRLLVGDRVGETSGCEGWTDHKLYRVLPRWQLDKRTYPIPAVPIPFRNKMPLAAKLFSQNCVFLQNWDSEVSETPYSIVCFELCDRQKSPKVHPNSTKTTADTVSPDTEFLQRWFVFILGFCRVLKGFLTISVWSYLTNPQKIKILANGPPKHFWSNFSDTTMQDAWQPLRPKFEGSLVWGVSLKMFQTWLRIGECFALLPFVGETCVCRRTTKGRVIYGGVNR